MLGNHYNDYDKDNDDDYDDSDTDDKDDHDHANDDDYWLVCRKYIPGKA